MAQVRPYLRQVGPGEGQTVAVLAHIAALEPALDEDLVAIAQLLGVGDVSVRAILRPSMASGLIDRLGPGYGVRPSMLGAALVASVFHGAAARIVRSSPGSDAGSQFDLLRSALRAAAVAPSARRVADRALDEGWFPAVWMPEYAHVMGSIVIGRVGLGSRDLDLHRIVGAHLGAMRSRHAIVVTPRWTTLQVTRPIGTRRQQLPGWGVATSTIRRGTRGATLLRGRSASRSSCSRRSRTICSVAVRRRGWSGSRSEPGVSVKSVLA